VETELSTEKNNATVLSAVPEDAPSFKQENPVDKESQEPPKHVSQRLVVMPKETANLLPSKTTQRRDAEKPMDKREPATLKLVSASKILLLIRFD